MADADKLKLFPERDIVVITEVDHARNLLQMHIKQIGGSTVHRGLSIRLPLEALTTQVSGNEMPFIALIPEQEAQAAITAREKELQGLRQTVSDLHTFIHGIALAASKAPVVKEADGVEVVQVKVSTDLRDQLVSKYLAADDTESETERVKAIERAAKEKRRK